MGQDKRNNATYVQLKKGQVLRSPLGPVPKDLPPTPLRGKYWSRPAKGKNQRSRWKFMAGRFGKAPPWAITPPPRWGRYLPSRFIFFTKGPWEMSHQRISANRDCNSSLIPKDYQSICRAVSLARCPGVLGLEPCTYKKGEG